MDKYLYLNKFLNNYMHELVNLKEFNEKRFQMIINKIYEIACIMVNFHTDNELLFRKKITSKETLELVLKYFKSINEIYEQKFLNALKEGIINLTTKEELENIEKNDANKIFFENVSGVIDDQYFINIILEENIVDAFLIIHEFSHYLNMKLDLENHLNYRLFTEGFATFFEMNFFYYLLKTKYRNDAINYYQTLELSLADRSNSFIIDFHILNIFLHYNEFNIRKMYRYFKDTNFKECYKVINLGMDILIDNMKDCLIPPFLSDGPYIIGIPLSNSAMNIFKKDKDEFFRDYEELNENSISYYYDKYVKDAKLDLNLSKN